MEFPLDRALGTDIYILYNKIIYIIYTKYIYIYNVSMCKNIYDAYIYIYILQKIDRVYRDDELFCWKKSFQYLILSAGNSINFKSSGVL